METPLEDLNAKIFREQLNTRFEAQLGNGEKLALTLEEVEERNTLPKIELFFLRFRGPLDGRLPQQICRLEHEKLGAIKIFMTAIGADEKGVQYESVFNRLRKPPAT